MDSTTINDQIATLAADACVELLQAYGVELTREDETWEPGHDTMCGVIGFVGTGIRGTCLLAADGDVLRRSCPSGNALRDWLGELANQLVGRVKMKLLAYGVDVALTTPLALTAVRVTPQSSWPLKPRVFATRSDRMLVALEIDASKAFRLGTFRQPTTASTGELVVFD